MKKTVLITLAFSLFTLAAPAAQQQGSAQVVSHTAKAFSYSRAGSTKLDMRGTDAMPQASGEAKVQSRTGRTDVEVKVANLDAATSFGLEYLTYVVWAISPQGRAANLGEMVLDHGSGKLKATTELQTFGLLVTAEPYFAVTQPSSIVVLENAARPDTVGKEEQIEFTYELIGRGAYASTNSRIKDAIFGIDPRTPLELFEARNALRIARGAGAEKYAAAALTRADQSLDQAESAYRQKNKTSVVSSARDAAQNAEEARVMSLKQQEKERLERESAEREAAAKAQADAEARRRQQAEVERQQAEAAKAEAERMREEAEAAAEEAAKAKEEAEAARAAALQQQQLLAEQAEKSKHAAEEAERLRQEAEKEKAEMRARLLAQLNAVLETHDTARGLIANMGDVLFETAKYELKPVARERLAKVSGILLAYPGLKVQVEGHTDSVGSDQYNQQLSEQRAGAVREYLVQQGVGDASITAQGFGKSQPIASNDTPEGRQKNRRVELVVSGDAIDKPSETAAK
jgi:outer membrane protein OmpA-like peptidoglycan-associated protein